MTHPDSHTGPDNPVAQGHETSDAHFKGVLATGFIFLGLMALGLLLSWGVYAVFREYTEAPGAHAETLTNPDLTKLPPGPNLEADPHASLVAMRKAEDSILTSYGWVNRDSGIVHIPIDRAMRLLAKKGLLQRERTPEK